MIFQVGGIINIDFNQSVTDQYLNEGWYFVIIKQKKTLNAHFEKMCF